LASVRYTTADVRFLQAMIVHHQQAVDMAALVADRTARNEMLDVAQRILASQKDEIAFMTTWLQERGEPVTGHVHQHHAMNRMASAEQLAALAAASGDAFDMMFLALMIKHLQGALTMVEDLLEVPGAAGTPEMFEFTRDVRN